MKFQVTENQIQLVDGMSVITTGNVNSIHCCFCLDSSYQGMDTFAVFYRDDTLNRLVELDKNGCCVIPWEMLETPGYLYIGVCGTQTNGEEVIKRITTNNVMLWVKKSLSSNVAPNAAPQPDIWEAYRTEILSIQTDIRQLAVQVAASAEEAIAAAITANSAASSALLYKQAVDVAAGQAAASAELAGTAANDAEGAASAAEESKNVAQTAAEEATASAQAAQEAAATVPADFMGQLADMRQQIAVLESAAIDTVSWKGIRNAVRLGAGPSLFPIGHEFTTLDSATGSQLTWVVRGHDHHTAADSTLAHTMTLEMKQVYSDATGAGISMQFDQAEAAYYTESGLPAGTYHFTVENQRWYTADNGKNFQFTLTKALPAGGQIVLNMLGSTTLAGKTAKTFASATALTGIEVVTISEGAAGTHLGITDGSGSMNHMWRIVYGSGNYAQSALRQWLNSGAAAGAVWSPATVFDRPPVWGTTKGGFMQGLPKDFLEAVQPAILPCRTCSIYEHNSIDGTTFAINQAYTVTDKFFILSRPEIYGTWDSTAYKDGTLLTYYDGLTTAERMKFDQNGTACRAWLRSTDPAYTHIEKVVLVNGDLGYYYANGEIELAAACIIA